MHIVEHGNNTTPVLLYRHQLVVGGLRQPLPQRVLLQSGFFVAWLACLWCLALVHQTQVQVNGRRSNVGHQSEISSVFNEKQNSILPFKQASHLMRKKANVR